jgi:DNA-binding IclR family transcriptional regulator
MEFLISKRIIESGGSQTVDRALAVLRIVATESRPIALEDVAARSGLHKSIAYRLLRSFENAGFIGRIPGVGGYTVAATLLSLSVLAVARMDMRLHARSMMEDIVARYGENASLHLRSGNLQVCVDVVDGTHAVRRAVPVGITLPVFAGETGRALLCELPDDELESVLADAKEAGMNADRTRADIMLTRKQGFFVGIGLQTPDEGSISIPIHGSAGILGAVTVSGPADRWNRTAMTAAAPVILSRVRTVSAILGESA